MVGRTYRVTEFKAVRESDATLIAHYQSESAKEPTVVVAERISASAREQLNRVNIPWLDRRGHLWVRADGVFVNVDIAPSRLPPTRVVDVLSGTGLDISIALLTSPEKAYGVNELARRISRSPGRVSEILTALRSEGLVESGNRPVVPQLFWDVADRWSTPWTPLTSAPPSSTHRYRLSGTLGAVALDAPIAGGALGRPQLYVIDATDLSALTNAYGGTGSGWAAAEVAVCPSRFGFSLTSGVDRDGYTVASHLLVALDLAQDRARGREVLNGWDPVGVPRVW